MPRILSLKKLQSLKEPERLAGAIGLHYTCDACGGLERRRAGRKAFAYYDAEGRAVRDHETLRRIKALAIPPAWREVWICADPAGHLQATGRDERGRKQYRYHPRWRRVSNQTKYYSLIQFGEALPALRRRVREDLGRTGLAKERVLAVAVRLLETTLIRIGNVEYAKANESFGLTTLQDDHVEIQGATIRFRFKGKSGVNHEITVADRRLAGLVKRCRDLPGYELFQYVNGDGEAHPIGSADVNEYLCAATGMDCSAKDFRTWGGTVEAARRLNDAGPAVSQAEAKKTVVKTVKAVAHLLGNRPATCRNYYIHPAIPAAYAEGELFEHFRRAGEVGTEEAGEGEAGLSRDERAVLSALRADFARAAKLTPEQLAETA